MLAIARAASADAEAPGTASAIDLADGGSAGASAEHILAAQPQELVSRLMTERVIVLQEVRRDGALTGALVSAFVIFDRPIDDVYHLLAQSTRQVEFRPELTTIVTVEQGPDAFVDEQRLKILFQRYVYRIAYRLFPERRRIEWSLDERFDNDLDRLSGFWALHAMADGRTLGHSGTSVDVGAAVPVMLQDWITRKNFPESMQRARRWVDSDGRYRP